MKNHTTSVFCGNSGAQPAKVIGLLGLLLVILLSPVPPLLGQTGQGTLTGTVTDASRAIVPAATVALTNIDTGVSVKGESSDVGIYYFGAVPIGHYKVVITKQGFKEWEGTFTLAVGQNAVVDPVLQVGSTATVVEVKAAAAPLETTNGAVADVKESNQIRDLPLDGRQVGQLFNLTAGVESGSGGARVNGMKVGSLDINLDGVTMVDRFGGGMVRVQPGIETIQEFRIETVGSEARFDQPATVIMASRSGSNQLHGGGYEYIRDNTVLGATRLRTDPVGSGFVLPELIRNEFGGYLGGPVVIPHLYNGRNKSFWFFDYEGLRDRERGSVEQPWVPTAAMWGGDLSNAVDLNSSCPSCPLGFTPITIYDPTSTNPTTFERTPFPNNQIPGPYSPTALALEALTEPPCCGAFALDNPYVAPNVTNTYPYIQTLNNYTAKWDENISDKDRLSVRYTRSLSNSAQEGGYYANPINPSSGMGSSARNYFNTNVAVNYNRTISPNWLNELLIGVLRDPNHIGTLADFTNWSAKLDTPNPFGVTGWPTLYTYETSVGSPSAYFGWDSDNNHKQHLTSETIEDNVTWTHGKHTIQFGFRGRKEQNNIEELQQAQGSHEWDPAYTTDWSPSAFSAAPDTGSGFAELLLGTPDYLSDQYNRGYFYFRQTEVGLYASDKIKVSPRLTLSLGLRWDKWTPYTEARNRLDVPYNPEQTGTFEVVTPGNININSLGTPPAVITTWGNIGLKYATGASVGWPSDLFRAINHDFAPRLGVAYQLNPKTVIRGSYGIYYVAMPLSLILQSTRDNPPLNLRFQNVAQLNPNVPGGESGPYFGYYPYIVAPAPTDYMPPNTVDITKPQNTVRPYGNGATYWDGPNWNDERQQTWNLTVEHELPGRIGARLSYIGTYGGNLEQQFAVDDQEPKYNYAVRTHLLPPSPADLLRPVPQWALIGLNHTGYSRDHSLQAEIHRTFANGIGFQAFYTFVRALTTTDPGGFSDGNTGVNGGGGSGSLGGSGGATVPESYEILGEPNLSYKQRLKLAYFNNTTIPPHRFTLDGIYDLPFGTGKHFAGDVSKSLNYLIGGWQLATIGTWNSGPWMGVSTSLVQTGPVRIPSGKRATFNIPGSAFRYRQWFAGDFDVSTATNVSGTPVPPVVMVPGPNCEGAYAGQLAVPLSNDPRNNGQTCYDAPFGGFYNPAPRDNIIAPGAWNDDLSLYKHFKFGERFDMRFSADAFNVFNHPNDVPPAPDTGLQNLGMQANGSRVIQLSVRVEF